MNRIIALLVLAFSLPAFGQESPATEATIRQVLEVTESRKMIDGVYPQVDAMMQAAMKQSAGTATFTPKKQAVLDGMREKFVALMKEDLRWETLEPQMIELYRKSFTETEMKGMLAFYRSPAGQALVRKMPQVMQGSMEMVQAQMMRIMPRLQAIQQETVEELRACCSDEG